MGQFSWIYCNEARPMEDDFTTNSYLLIPEPFQKDYGGKKYIHITNYDGYGNFGKYDVYEEVAKWNKDAIPAIIERIENDNWRCIRKNKETGDFSEWDKKELVSLYNYMDGNLDCQLRDIGINMACYDEDNCRLPYPIKIASKPMLYEVANPSIRDSNQGWNRRIDTKDKERYEQVKNGTYEPLKDVITLEEKSNKEER